MVFLYLGNEILNFIKNFFYFWYFEVPYHYFLNFVNLFNNLERSFALRITIENFFVPLWQDYTLIGRMISLFIRASKILVTLIIYLLFFLGGILILTIIEILPLILFYLAL